MKNLKLYSFVILLASVITACNEDSTEDPNTISNPDGSSNFWLIPKSEIIDGGPGKDGIPALLMPEFSPTASITYLDDDDLIIGIKVNDEIRGYPHAVLDWHEIVNDEIKNQKFALTYCPLTGTGMAWERGDNTFGVSGLLYNNNLIPYDRDTDSNWSQIGLQCVNGELIEDTVELHQMIETKWSTWKSLFPESTVMSLNTGYSRSYDRYPYGNYKEDESLLFPSSQVDSRLHAKERVHGVISDGKSKVYQLKHFVVPQVIVDEINETRVVVVGSDKQNFIVSFEEIVINEEILIFSIPTDLLDNGSFKSTILMEDQFGNQWDVFGYAISGPNQGERLKSTNSFMGYFFSFAPFYGSPAIYSE